MGISVAIGSKIPKFVQGLGGIVVTNANGVVTISFDYEASQFGAELAQAIATASGYADGAEAAQAGAEAALAAAQALVSGLNLPSIDIGDTGQVLVVNPTGTGFVTQPTSSQGVDRIIKKLQSGAVVSAAQQGDSTTYGLLSTGGLATYPAPSAFSIVMNDMPGWHLSMTNRGISGHKSADGVASWAAAPAVDLLFIQYGTNDAIGNVSVDVYAANIEKMILKGISDGSTVILLSPYQIIGYNIYAGYNFTLRNYTSALRDLAAKYDLLLYNTEEQLRWMVTFAYGTDYVHLSEQGYFDSGWALASVFVGFTGREPRKVTNGDRLDASQDLGFGGVGISVSQNLLGDGKYLLGIASGATIHIGLDVQEDCYVYITDANGTPGTPRGIWAFDSGWDGVSATCFNGATPINHVNDGNSGIYNTVRGPFLPKGKRILTVFGAGGNPAFLAGLEFRSVNAVAIDWDARQASLNTTELLLKGPKLNLGAGGQLKFPASQNASTDPNTLDDYEEGTFTPIIFGTSAAGAGTYSVQIGRYVKIGRLVYFDAILTWTSHTGTGDIRVGGLPFTLSAAYSPAFNIVAQNLTYSGQLVAYGQAASTTAIIQSQATGAALASVAMDTAATVTVSGVFLV